MTAKELQALVGAAMRDAGGEPKAWDLDQGDEDHLAGPDGLAQWLAVLDDRTPGSDGPLTFDGPEFDKMLRATILLVVDYASEPDVGVYELLGHWVARGSRVSSFRPSHVAGRTGRVISAHSAKRTISPRSCQLRMLPRFRVGFALPVLAAPSRDGRQTASDMDQSQHAEWGTPWGPAFRLTRIAKGIEFFETATVSCYRLTSARNAEVLGYWRDVATSGCAQAGWYSEKDPALVILAVPSYFGADEIPDA